MQPITSLCSPWFGFQPLSHTANGARGCVPSVLVLASTSISAPSADWLLSRLCDSEWLHDKLGNAAFEVAHRVHQVIVFLHHATMLIAAIQAEFRQPVAHRLEHLQSAGAHEVP